MTKVTIEMPYGWNWLLQFQLKKAMRRDWEESIFMAKNHKLDEVYFEERIDKTADILLQLNAQLGSI